MLLQVYVIKEDYPQASNLKLGDIVIGCRTAELATLLDSEEFDPETGFKKYYHISQHSRRVVTMSSPIRIQQENNPWKYWDLQGWWLQRSSIYLIGMLDCDSGDVMPLKTLEQASNTVGFDLTVV